MPTPLLQPALTFNFQVTMWDVQGPGFFGDAVVGAAASAAGQLIFGSFAEVQGLEGSVEIETYQEGGRNERVYRFAKASKFPNLVFKRGVTARTDLWDWQTQVVASARTAIRKSGLVILFDRNGPGSGDPALGGLTRIPVAAWMFHRGLPEKLQGPVLDAKGNSIAIEILEISHERLERISLGAIPKLGDLASRFPSLT
ncbi:MAG: phage tail protein [Deltaproteobacteria bacterium]|nr:phage tail protein [Deltaproteobacteria bacterium]MCW5801154.1 phage tail protein [Deltaproteobacteria bacterium]